MTELRMRGQYYCDGTPEDVPCREENFQHGQMDFALPVDQTALVLVDVWNIHHIESWVDRAVAVTKDVIVPVLAAARAAGLTIVHAPSPECIKNHDYLKRRLYGKPAAPPPEPTWPPREFRDRKGEFAMFMCPRYHPPGIGTFWDRRTHELDINPLIRVREGENVVETGQQLHELCEAKRILHLVYAGFSTNGCLLRRDYGVVPMWERGYYTVLIRDANAGVEWPDTLEKKWATELAIREVEQRNGFSILSADFINACKKAR